MATPLHIVADRDIPFLKGVLEPYARVTYLEGSRIGRNDLMEADALLVRTRTQCDRALLERTPIQLIASATIGHDHIDTHYCATQGVAVRSAAGCNARGVLQYVMAALAALSEPHPGSPLWLPGEKKLGVIGVGHVGKLVAQFGELFGFEVLCCDPPRQMNDPTLPFWELDELLAQCDIVSLHLPLTKQGAHPTLGLASSSFFSQLKPGTIFINTSRGGVIDDRALLTAMRNAEVSASVIDTWNGEPHSIYPELLRLSTFSTPHIAGYTLQGKAAGSAAVVAAVSKFFNLPLQGWYPDQAPGSHPDTTLGWEEMKKRMRHYFDIEAESQALKTDPESFDRQRNHYNFRTEFF